MKSIEIKRNFDICFNSLENILKSKSKLINTIDIARLLVKIDLLRSKIKGDRNARNVKAV